MNLLIALESYSRLCDELQTLAKEENYDLRLGRTASELFLDRKREASARMERALVTLRSCGAADPVERAQAKQVHASVQQRLLKIILLDRENEQLLLKLMHRSAQPATRPQGGAALLRGAYGAS